MISLESNITSSETSIKLNRHFTTSEIPSAGVVLIESEEIHYSSAAGDTLVGCTRGFNGTSAADHLAGTEVTLVVEELSVSPISKLSEDQRDRLPSPVSGTLIYNTTSDKLNVYNGTDWEVITSA